MPVRAEVDDGMIALRMIGEYETADIRAALRAALDAEPAGSLRGLLFDVRESTVLAGRPAEALREMASFLASVGPAYGGRLATVASADFAYGLMRMGTTLVEFEGTETAVFRDEAEAWAWLRR